MTFADEIRSLQSQLINAHKKFGVLTHPVVVSLSQQLDQLIMEFYRNKQALSAKKTIGKSE